MEHKKKYKPVSIGIDDKLKPKLNELFKAQQSISETLAPIKKVLQKNVVIDDFKDMLKQHHITVSIYMEEVNKSKHSLKEYTSLAMEYNVPLGITWDERREKLYEYKETLNDKDYNEVKLNYKEWYDLLWFDCEKFNDTEGINFLWENEYRHIDDLPKKLKDAFKAIIERVTENHDKANAIARDWLAEKEDGLYGIKVAVSNHLADEQLKKFESKYNRAKLASKSLPPRNAPPVIPKVDEYADLYVIAGNLVEELKAGKHDWAYGSHMNLFRWASWKYTINGKQYTPKKWLDSYNSVNTKNKYDSPTLK